jgi:cytochrome c553
LRRVPRGAVNRGKALVQHAPQPCTSCHGATLKGTGSAPPLAGRNPHYLARAIWDIKTCTRWGPTVALMQKPAGSLSADQIVDITAYLASLPR